VGATPDGGARQRSGKSRHFRVACFDGAGAEHHDDSYRFRVRALFLVTPCACRGLYARHSGLRTLSFAGGFVAQVVLVLAIFKML
jgi:hypothetical protein